MTEGEASEPSGQVKSVMDPITIEPVAWVVGDPEDEDGTPQNQVIEVLPEYGRGLLRIEDCDHLWVLFWMSELRPEQRNTLQVHPRGNRDNPLTGVFAVHSPMRPNPIGMTKVRLVKRDGLRLTVEGLDAFDGSPVIDIKSG